MKNYQFCENLFANDILNYILRNRHKANLFTVDVHSIAKSRMSRKMRVMMVYKSRIINLGYVLKLSGLKWFKVDDDNLIIVGGCGMDMMFWCTYEFVTKIIQKAQKLGFKGIVKNLDAAHYYNRF